MKFKAMLAVMILGGSGTVLALAAASPERATPKAEPTIAAVAQQPAGVVAPAVAAPPKTIPKVIGEKVAEDIANPAPMFMKVAAAAPPNDTIIWSEPRPPAADRPAADQAAPTQRQLDALLAPIALYPDQLLSQILMASTYPLEVVEAARWVSRPENEGLQGDRLADALEAQDWDPSVKALAAFPHILKMMDADLDWMAQLGDAFQAEETAVMDSVQHLRREAKAADKLNSDARQRVTVLDSQIIIEPANPQVVYVPFYDPQSAYGLWPYPDYPPAYIPPPLGYTYSPGVYYSFVSVSPFWGWSRWDWSNRRIHITDVPRYTHYNRGRGPFDNDVWRHDPRRDSGRGTGNRFRGNDRPNDRPDNRRDNRPDNRMDRTDNSPPPATPQVRRPRGPVVPGTNFGDNTTVDAARPFNMRRRGAAPPSGSLPDVTPPLPASQAIPAPAAPIGEAPPAFDTNRFDGNRRRQRDPSVPQADNTPDRRQDDIRQDSGGRRGFRQFRDNNNVSVPAPQQQQQQQPRGSRRPEQPTQVFVPPPQAPAIAAVPQPQQDEQRGENFRQRGYVPPPAPGTTGDDGRPCQRMRGGACR